MLPFDPAATLSIAKNPGYLKCQMTQIPCLEAFREVLKVAAAICTCSSLSALLMDVRAVGSPPSIMVAYDLAEAISEVLPARCRIAILATEISPSRRFLETVAVNRRSYLSYFTDHAQAVVWMLGTLVQSA